MANNKLLLSLLVSFSFFYLFGEGKNTTAQKVNKPTRGVAPLLLPETRRRTHIHADTWRPSCSLTQSYLAQKEPNPPALDIPGSPPPPPSQLVLRRRRPTPTVSGLSRFQSRRSHDPHSRARLLQLATQRPSSRAAVRHPRRPPPRVATRAACHRPPAPCAPSSQPHSQFAVRRPGECPSVPSARLPSPILFKP